MPQIDERKDSGSVPVKGEGEAAPEHHEAYWHVNPGDEKIHAARIAGRFRNYKWTTAALYLFFFFGPYLRWGGRQAVLFDIPGRKFHIFGFTVWPQDVWMLALVLIFLALLLFATTAIAGRVFCGYFCFQTVWTDIFTLIEDKLEGPPYKRRQLDAAPWTARKFALRATKLSLWSLIALLTGITFAAYFADAFWLWRGYLTLSAPLPAWVTLGFFYLCAILFAGYLREQVCFWLCPYARIQGVMYDSDTILPTYDYRRGEPRTRLRRGKEMEGAGDCIDCNLCAAVCPTGIDIRHGQQEGCITCGLCIDACDSIMEKVARPRGLIRYASLDEMKGVVLPPLFRRPRVIIYSTVLFLALSGILYGLFSLGGMTLTVIHERQPLFVRMSDGTIQNKYTLKVVNKTGRPLPVRIEVVEPKGATAVGIGERQELPADRVVPVTVFVRIPPDQLKGASTPLRFRAVNLDEPGMESTYESMFLSPGGG